VESIITVISSGCTGTWVPRGYAITWAIVSESNKVDLTHRFSSQKNLNWMDNRTRSAYWNLYSQTSALASKILEVCVPVRFDGQAPREPFEWIAVELFHLVSEGQIIPRMRQAYTFTSIQADRIESKEDVALEDGNQDQTESLKEIYRAWPVDGRISCAFDSLCTMQAKDASIYCSIHH
jgi:hypothetical protein